MLKIFSKKIYIFLTVITISLLSPAASVSGDSYYDWEFSKYDLRNFKEAFKQYGRKNWKSSILKEYRPKDLTLRKVLRWKEYVSGSPATNFKEISRFISYNPYWPFQEKLRRIAEESMNEFSESEDIFVWFSITPPVTDKELKFKKPLTAKGKHLLAEAMMDLIGKYQFDSNLIPSLIKDAFVEYDFNSKKEKAFIEKYQRVLTNVDFEKRTERLLTERNYTAASRMVKHLSKEYKKIYDARVYLSLGKKGVDKKIAAVPLKMRNDPGLLYDRIKWREQRNIEEGVVSLLKKVLKNPVYPEKLWTTRRKYIKNLIKSKNYQDAYLIAKNHAVKYDKATISNAEWYAGWLALRFLNNPVRAFDHFQNIARVGRTPITNARANYWMARSKEALGDIQSAQKYYTESAKYPLTYYGQLSLLKTGKREISLPPDAVAKSSDIKNFKQNELAKAANFMFQISQNYYAKVFLQAAVNQSQTRGERLMATNMGIEKGRYDYSIRSAKEAYNNHNQVYFSSLFPAFNLTSVHGRLITNPATEFVLAIIRQESEFDTDAVSHAGARGLMQLMPRTAQSVANSNKLKYSRVKLNNDARYNVTLGSSYLASRMELFDGSYILSAAAYNAGAGNVNKWIREYGDPRKMDNLDDVIDWIETIPFSETNNYVQRVLENIQVYRYVLSGKKYKSINIDQDLMAGGN